jgi:hypothetical protein
VTARTSKHLAFSFQPVDRVFSENLVVFASQSTSLLAALQSRVHVAWVRHTSSTLEDRQGYRPSDCFETFPFPQPDPRTVIPTLETIGQELYDARARFMVETDQGLTKTYNAIKDPACDDPRVVELRRLHEAMDRAVLDAYGWTDVAVPPCCPATDADRAAVQAFEDEAIDRLYVLNAERAREEERLGLGSKKGKKVEAGDAAKPVKTKGRRAKADAGDDKGGQTQMF